MFVTQVDDEYASLDATWRPSMPSPIVVAVLAERPIGNILFAMAKHSLNDRVAP
jgi:hypothetical protein